MAIVEPEKPQEYSLADLIRIASESNGNAFYQLKEITRKLWSSLYDQLQIIYKQTTNADPHKELTTFLETQGLPKNNEIVARVAKPTFWFASENKILIPKPVSTNDRYTWEFDIHKHGEDRKKYEGTLIKYAGFLLENLRVLLVSKTYK